MLIRTANFSPEDIALALELIDSGLDRPDQKDYCFILATDEEGRITGYTCYGPTPLTHGTYSLYWIVVDQDFARRGLGSLLLKCTEDRIGSENGRLIALETSSAQDYELTRRFYQKNGYTVGERLKDFYRPGEDRITFVKFLNRLG